MKKDKYDFLEQSLKMLKSETDLLPTKEQKERMLQNILYEAENQKTNTWLQNIKEFIINRPYRFAFSISAIQAIVFTVLFGSNYTNLILNLFG
ncbi:hypothetical protein LV832_15855 [[Clostridium] innocuum]|uniref:hypothetical protein n=1 Tax=Clostridium innocuum TaxID=1522 RepID=UPI001FED2BBE|nr:hypothetical protein [[Clostridium] innocuum]MCI2988874.1 hypothetical protein [[Clostridium] innocuum]